MAKAVFKQDFNYSSRVHNVGWAITASPEPQDVTRECLDAAIAAGVAEEVKPTRKNTSKPEQED